MSRYIDYDAIDYRNDRLHDKSEKFLNGVIYMAQRIEDAPTIDIVRCKECRYCKRKNGTFKGEPIIFYRCEENNRDVESDDYCSFGERKATEITTDCSWR